MPFTASQTAAAHAAVKAFIKTEIEKDAPFLIKSQAEEGLESQKGDEFVAGCVAAAFGAVT